MSVPVRRVCLLLALTLLLSLVTVAPGSPTTTRPPTPETRSATVDGLAALTGQAGTDGDADGGARTEGGARIAADEPATRTATIEAPLPFVSLGITGTGPAPDLRVRTRDRDDGQWTDWVELHGDDGAHGPDAGTAEAARADQRGGWASEAVWAGPSTHVEVEVTGAAPETLEVTFIDTAGLSESVVERVGRWARSLVGGQPAQAAGGSGLRPDIVTREQWGANEDWRSGTPSEYPVKFGVLHHTANSNDYSREEADDLVRSIYYYHAVTRGWNDIGYNFLVDKYGTIYEGRHGGMDKGIRGAHVAGWNTNSFGVSLIGNFNDYNPPTVAVDAVTDVFTWKYAVHGLDPDHDATVWHNNTEIRTMESHRNLRGPYVKGSNDPGFQEDCPGRWLYWQTPRIRGGTDTHQDGIEDRLDRAFGDVGNAHPFHTDIVWAAATEVTDGYSDGTFGPARAVSRQAMAAFLYRLAGQPPAPTTSGFSDVPPTHPFHDEIAWAGAKGLVTGYGDGTFRPAEQVTRQAAAAFLHRYAGSPAADGSSRFSDVDRDHPFHEAISWAADAGVTDGYPDGTFRPGDEVVRQAAAAFLHRMDDDAGAWLQVASVEATAASDTVTSEQDNTITATVVDHDGEPLDDVSVAFSGGRGELSPSADETGAGGRATTTYSPAAADEGGTVTITADAEGQASDTATFTVEEPVELSVSADAEKDVVTAGEDNTITATVVDQHGEPVEGVTVGFSGGSGDYSTTSATTGADGVATTVYTAAADDEGSKVAVTADAQGEASDLATFTVESEPEPDPSESESETA